MNYEIFPISIKIFDLFDSSPKLLHRHTICAGIEVSTKNRLEKTFIHLDSFLTIFVG
jgi:hypothetical protein